MSALALIVGLLLVVIGAYLVAAMGLGNGWLYRHGSRRWMWLCLIPIYTGFLLVCAAGAGLIGDGL